VPAVPVPTLMTVTLAEHDAYSTCCVGKVTTLQKKLPGPPALKGVEPAQIVNTWPESRLLDWVASRR
jgi:hypothetical protein